MLYGVDIAEYQGNLNIAQVQKEGFSFIAIKASGSKVATKGDLYRDPKWFDNVELANKTGLVKIGYHYLANNSYTPQPATQAAMLWDAVTAAGHDWAACVDVEDATVDISLLSGFLSAWDSLTDGMELVVYTDAGDWNRAGLAEYKLPLWCRLWLAKWIPAAIRNRQWNPNQYASQQAHFIDPGAWDSSVGGAKPSLLQFTNNALVAGQYMDADVFPGTKQQLKALLGLEGV